MCRIRFQVCDFVSCEDDYARRERRKLRFWKKQSKREDNKQMVSQIVIVARLGMAFAMKNGIRIS